MAIASAADIARARAAAQGQNRPKRAYFQYPPLDRTKQLQLQAIKTGLKTDERFGKPEYGMQKAFVTFVVLVRGWEKATTKEEQDAFRLKQHGRYITMDFNPAITPPGKNRTTGEATKPSNLYLALCVLLNDGKPLTDEQMDRRDEKGLVEWGRQYNAELEAAGGEPIDLKDTVEVRAHHSAWVMAKLLNEVELRQPQVLGMVEPYVKKNGQPDVKMKLLVSLAEEEFEPWHPYERPFDPREEGDDPNVVCTVTGRRIRGWEGNEGWMTNAQWAAKQVEKLGEDFRYVLDGQEYAPPFGPQHYGKALEQWKASNGATEHVAAETAGAGSDDPGF